MEKCKNPKCDCKPCKCQQPCTCGLDGYEKTTIENLVLDLTAAKKLAEDNLNLAKYQKAEFENYKKRERAGADAAFNEGRAFCIINFLPVFDALAEAMKVVRGEDRKGLEILERKFDDILKSFGVTEVEAALGDKFNPYIHNSIAVGKVEGKPSGTILEVWQKGYKLDNKVIRPASVKVNE
jgi:molecular chaperone GrpE